MEPQASQAHEAPSTDRQSALRYVVLGTKPEGRSNLSEALSRIGVRMPRLVADPSSTSLEHADAVLIDGESYGKALPWVVECALAATQAPILIVGGTGELVQSGSPRVFVTSADDVPAEVTRLLHDIVTHLVANS
ncbi:MAG: hypothetical protein O2884_03590 [Chloroflexi bacterium]|nr:hypothetical protein [Chloroflexota bacterium]